LPMRNNEIDNQIDEAARRLTAGEPGGDVRARVLARIATSPAEAGHHVLSRKWIAVPLALAAALVIAVWSTRSAHEIQQVHEVQPVQQVQQVQTAHDVPQVAEVQHTSTERPVNLVNSMNQVNPIEVEQSPFAPAPLDIAPLTLDEIPPVPAIVVEELTVSPIEVRAIDETVAPDALAQ
jgi:hypothetical protein